MLGSVVEVVLEGLYVADEVLVVLDTDGEVAHVLVDAEVVLDPVDAFKTIEKY